MKISYLVTAIIFMAVMFMGCRESQKVDSEINKSESKNLASFPQPPASLDSLYPPHAKFPVFLVKMHEMSGAFVGILSDLFEGDTENSGKNYLRFKEKYSEISQLVPEWNSLTPHAPVIALGEALQSGDKDTIMAAFGAVEKICHDCHESNMTSVQMKFHWKDFGQIMVTDPVTGQDLPYNRYMQFLDLAFTGIMNDVAQGQQKAALAYLDQFSQRLNTLEETCYECHSTERFYFVDEQIKNSLNQMEKEIRKSEMNVPKIAGLFQEIGMESCNKCHLVHTPSYFIKKQWKMTAAH